MMRLLSAPGSLVSCSSPLWKTLRSLETNTLSSHSGSGKSTLADAICSQVPVSLFQPSHSTIPLTLTLTYTQNWTRVCQDDLGNRRKCEKTTLEALSEVGAALLFDTKANTIDICGPTRRESMWLSIGKTTTFLSAGFGSTWPGQPANTLLCLRLCSPPQRM